MIAGIGYGHNETDAFSEKKRSLNTHKLPKEDVTHGF